MLQETAIENIIYKDGCVNTFMEKLREQTNILIIGLTLLGIMLVMVSENRARGSKGDVNGRKRESQRERGEGESKSERER